MFANSIKYVLYSPENGGSDLTERLIDCYKDVFATKPWSEWLKCARCGQYWGKEDEPQLIERAFQCCGSALTDYWPRDTVLDDLQTEIGPESVCWLALDRNRVVGFCWGYPMPLNRLEQKLGLSIDWPSAQKDKSACVVAYQDEIGVLGEYRGSKIATNMYRRYIRNIQGPQIQAFLARTKQGPEPSILYAWYTQKYNYSVAASYPATDGRVILCRQADNTMTCG